jgi:hypothetical protein
MFFRFQQKRYKLETLKVGAQFIIRDELYEFK